MEDQRTPDKNDLITNPVDEESAKNQVVDEDEDEDEEDEDEDEE